MCMCAYMYTHLYMYTHMEKKTRKKHVKSLSNDTRQRDAAQERKRESERDCTDNITVTKGVCWLLSQPSEFCGGKIMI